MSYSVECHSSIWNRETKFMTKIHHNSHQADLLREFTALAQQVDVICLHSKKKHTVNYTLTYQGVLKFELHNDFNGFLKNVYSGTMMLDMRAPSHRNLNISWQEWKMKKKKQVDRHNLRTLNEARQNECKKRENERKKCKEQGKRRKIAQKTVPKNAHTIFISSELQSFIFIAFYNLLLEIKKTLLDFYDTSCVRSAISSCSLIQTHCSSQTIRKGISSDFYLSFTWCLKCLHITKKTR